MKIINCLEQNSQNYLESLQNEKNILALVEGDFVVKPYFTFKHENFICFCTEYLTGGDLAKLLEREGRVEEKVARFVTAELILAVEYLHRNNIIHRDLKPHNILIDTHGHIKLTDFGLSTIGHKEKHGHNYN